MILYKTDKKELHKLITEMKAKIEVVNEDHRDGRGSQIGAELERKMLIALEEIHYEMNYDLYKKYKI